MGVAVLLGAILPFLFLVYRCSLLRHLPAASKFSRPKPDGIDLAMATGALGFLYVNREFLPLR